ncbi:MAG: serine hydrolase domain-containing protein [Flavitalea sp.]
MKNFIKWLPLLLLTNCKDDKKEQPLTDSSNIVSSASQAQSISPAELKHYKGIAETFYQESLGKGKFNGSFLVAKNGQIIYEQYAGYRDPRVKRDSITSSTSFHLASVSKPFTAMAVLKLWEEGKIQIDSAVSKYLQGFPLQDVTIRNLLNHRSGIPNYVHYMERLGWDRKRQITNADVVTFIKENHQKIQIGRPDRNFSYSNTNYALLAVIVEQVTGLTFPEYMRLNVFEPLSMHDSYVFTPSDNERSLSSFFYSGREYAFDYLDLVYGDKNIYSTVRDLMKFDQALNTGALLKQQTLDAAYTPYSNEKKGINNYGLGWRMQVYPNSKKIIYHNGWWHGNRTAFYRLLDENATIIALSNNDNKMVYKTKKLALAFGNYDSQGQNDEVDQTVTINNAKGIAKSNPGQSNTN